MRYFNFHKIIALISLGLIGISLFSPILLSTTDSYPKAQSDTHKLDFTMLFHANQANVPYGDVANDLNYYHVLDELRNHPNLHFPIHFSGTLLTDLAWDNQTTLDLLRGGINDSQFEIIGSTYAQNIPYSIQDNWDNQNQINVHKEVIYNILGVTPTGFWNPERCWNQSQYIPLIKNAGYDYTFIEDQILEKSANISGMEEYKVRESSWNGQSLKIINDDKSVLNLMDIIALTPKPATDLAIITAVDNLIDFLHSVYDHDTNNDYLVCYAQDMEAWGLWQEEGGNRFVDGKIQSVADSYQNVMGRLDYLLTRLENESDWLNIDTPSEFLNQLPENYVFDSVQNYVNGQADWMIAPSINEGYKDWFDFNTNDTRLQAFRQQFRTVSTNLQTIESQVNDAGNTENNTAAVRLLDYAKLVYAAHQFEFGCIGCYFSWYNASALALIPAQAALLALEKPSEGNTITFSADWDLDGNSEFLMANSKDLYVFSGNGGRLINWFDLTSGTVLIGQDISNTYSGVSGQTYQDGTPFSMPIGQINSADLWGRTNKAYKIREKAFNDAFDSSIGKLDPEIWYGRNRTTTISGDSIEFSMEFNKITVIKQFSLDNTKLGLQVSYEVKNNARIAIQPEIECSFSPDNLHLLTDNRSIDTLDPWTLKDQTRVLVNNVHSKISIILEIENSNLNLIKKDEISPMFGQGFTAILNWIQPGDSLNFSMVIAHPLTYCQNLDDVNNFMENGESSHSGKISSSFSWSVLIAGSTIALVMLITQRRQIVKK
ncbi:MAG: hypothetical protein ACTSVU_00535 [Promethearchaeota archaeon]